MSVTFIGSDTPAGAIPITFGTTPATGGQSYFPLFTNSAQGASFTMNGTTSVVSNVPVSGQANFGDGGGNDTYSLWATLNATGGAENFTVSQPSGDSLIATIALNFSGGVSTKNALYTPTANPAGGIVYGQSVPIAAGDILVALCYNSDVFGNAPTVSTAGSTAIASGFGGCVAVYWNGAGANIQPSFNSAVGDPNQIHQVVQWIVSATSGPMPPFTPFRQTQWFVTDTVIQT